MWNAASQISTALALTAFLAVLGLAAYRSWLKQRRATLDAAVKMQDPGAIGQILDRYNPNLTNLPPEEAVKVAFREIKSREKRNRGFLIVSVLVVLIFGIVAVLSVLMSGGPERSSLNIRKVTWLDEKFRSGPLGQSNLTQLANRNRIDYKFTSLKDVFLAVGFTIHGYRQRSDGTVNLEYALVGMRNDGSGQAFRVHNYYRHVNDWKNTAVAQTVGAEKVMQVLEVQGDELPVIAIAECPDPSLINPWSGEVLIEVIDRLEPQQPFSAPSPTIRLLIDKPHFDAQGNICSAAQLVKP